MASGLPRRLQAPASPGPQGGQLGAQWLKRTSGRHRAQPFPQSRTARDTGSGQLWLCLVKSWITIKVFFGVQHEKKIAVQGYVLVNRVEDVPSSIIGSFSPLTMGNIFSYPFILPWHIFLLCHMHNGTSGWAKVTLSNLVCTFWLSLGSKWMFARPLFSSDAPLLEREFWCFSKLTVLFKNSSLY